MQMMVAGQWSVIDWTVVCYRLDWNTGGGRPVHLLLLSGDGLLPYPLSLKKLQNSLLTSLIFYTTKQHTSLEKTNLTNTKMEQNDGCNGRQHCKHKNKAFSCAMTRENKALAVPNRKQFHLPYPVFTILKVAILGGTITNYKHFKE